MGPMFPAVDDAVTLLSDLCLPHGFDTTENPGLVDTPDKLERVWAETGRVCVWTGFSDHTIFGSPIINHRSRAWHDRCHLIGRYPHDHAGERATLSVQQAMVRQLRLSDGDLICRVLACEVIGQVEYYYRTGAFPDDQRKFAAEVIGLWE